VQYSYGIPWRHAWVCRLMLPAAPHQPSACSSSCWLACSPACAPAACACPQVDRVIAHRTRLGRRSFLVKWRGLGYAESTWESERDLQGEVGV
jgi:hypothetical protein